MPIYKSHTILHVVHNVKAFLTFNMGVTRGEVPTTETLEARLHEQTRRLELAQASIRKQERQLREFTASESASSRDKQGSIDPKNIVWIMGSPRTGSTWLGKMLRKPRERVLWGEPFFGVVLGFRKNLANRGYTNSDNFLLGEPHKEVWIGSMRRLFLDVGQAKFPDISTEQYLIVKEPNGSLSAPLILEAFPESRLIFLMRDSRDVVASLLDAAKEESWYGYNRYEASVAEALWSGNLTTLEHRSEEEFIEQLAKNYMTNIGAVKAAYDKHPDALKVMVRYEDLRNDPLKHIVRICDTLQIQVDKSQLEQAVKKHSWENVPDDKKGFGKHHRKATPGGWQEDLTPEQATMIERITAPILHEYYPREG